MGVAAYKGDDTTGFQSPAQDHVEGVPNLFDYLDLTRPQRYAVRVRGNGLRSRGIHEGDILVVSTDTEPSSGKICVAFVHGDVVLATLSQNEGRWWIEPSDQSPLPLSEDVEIWAVISALIRTDI